MQKHNAGRHLVVAHAMVRGRAAKIVGTSRYVELDGVQVVVMVATMGAWQIEDVDQFTAASAECYALVNFTGGATDIYVVPGEDLRRDVRTRHIEYMQRVGGVRPRNPDSKHTKIEPSEITQWRQPWL